PRLLHALSQLSELRLSLTHGLPLYDEQLRDLEPSSSSQSLMNCTLGKPKIHAAPDYQNLHCSRTNPRIHEHVRTSKYSGSRLAPRRVCSNQIQPEVAGIFQIRYF